MRGLSPECFRFLNASPHAPLKLVDFGLELKAHRWNAVEHLSGPDLQSPCLGLRCLRGLRERERELRALLPILRFVSACAARLSCIDLQVFPSSSRLASWSFALPTLRRPSKRGRGFDSRQHGPATATAEFRFDFGALPSEGERRIRPSRWSRWRPMRTRCRR